MTQIYFRILLGLASAGFRLFKPTSAITLNQFADFTDNYGHKIGVVIYPVYTPTIRFRNPVYNPISLLK